MGRKEKRKRYYFLKPGRKIYSINTYFFVKSRGGGKPSESSAYFISLGNHMRVNMFI
jgi:hypothetical protein|tara:strand:- start:345 stop:515 length:171 start_codon:yes stop_codon:yes gene_type:complete